MVEVAASFYRELFSRREVDWADGDFFLAKVEGQVPVEVTERMEGEVCAEEVRQAMLTLKTGKVPGVDGLSVEFYRALWGLVGEDFAEVVKEGLGRGRLC